MQPTSVRPLVTFYRPILAPVGNSSISEVEPPAALSSWGHYQLQLVKLTLASQASLMLINIVDYWTMTWSPMLSSFRVLCSQLQASQFTVYHFILGGLFAKAGLGAEHPENVEKRKGAQKPVPKTGWTRTSGLFLLCNKTKTRPFHCTMWVGKSPMWAQGLP